MTTHADRGKVVKSVCSQGRCRKFRFSQVSDFKIEKIIDNWPAHSINWSMADRSDSAKNENPSSMFKARSKEAVKPKFLEAVENTLRNRLEETGLLKAEPCIERLCIFREAFDVIISNFKTYQPLLSSIKKEYENVLQYFRNVARQLGPTQELLFTVTNEYESRITSNANKENKEIKSLKERIELLENKIKRMKEEQKGSKVAQEKLHEKLENLSDSLLRETDARKLAILDLNHLRTEYSDLLEYTKELNYQNQEGGDPVTLKIALDRAHEAHTQAVRRIVYLETEYNDVVPKREFSEVQNRLLLAESEVERLKAQCQDLDTQLVAKTEELSATVREKRELADMFAALQDVSTPRPDWPRVGGLVPGGHRRWRQLTTGKTSKEKLVIFATELAGEANVAPLTRSDGPESEETKKKFPKFLEGCLQILPRLFPKHDLLLLLEHVWLGRQKQLADYLKSRGAKEHLKLPNFNDFLYEYLKKAFGVETIRREWCLSLYVAGDVMTECEEIVRFRKVIDNEVDEAYHWYLRSLTGRLFGQLREMAHATAIAFALSTKSTEADGKTVSVAPTAAVDKDVAPRKPDNECRLTVHQLGIILAKLLQCEPQDPAVLRLIQAAIAREDGNNEEGEAVPTTAIDMDMPISLEELFHQVPGEQIPHFAQMLVRHLEQGRRTIIERITAEIQRQKSEDVTSMVTPAEVLEAMKVVRPEFESIIDSSPNCFFSLKQQQWEPPQDKRGNLRGVFADDFAVCDLDETNATPEEQALAWARCTSSEEAKNYLTATVHWIFQPDSMQTTTDRAIPLEVLVRRLYGANIKPNNRITAVN